MKSKLIFLMAATWLVAACGKDDGVARADQKDYEVVQEGSANGVTSTIQGPGESLPAITGTNADTTTAFSINPNAAGAVPAAPATMAGTLPVDTAPIYTPTPAPSPRPTTRQAEPVPAPRPTPEPAREMEPRPEPVPAEEPLVEPAPTETAVPPQAEPEPAPVPQEEAEEEPPPPTNTDTRGN